MAKKKIIEQKEGKLNVLHNGLSLQPILISQRSGFLHKKKYLAPLKNEPKQIKFRSLELCSIQCLCTNPQRLLFHIHGVRTKEIHDLNLS